MYQQTLLVNVGKIVNCLSLLHIYEYIIPTANKECIQCVNKCERMNNAFPIMLKTSEPIQLNIPGNAKFSDHSKDMAYRL